VHDVVGVIVFAEGDEDLLPGDAIAAVARALGRRIRDLPLTRERIMDTLLAE